MNLLLFSEADCIAPQKAVITGKRAQHIGDVLRLQCGDHLRVGQINGLMGTARIRACVAGQQYELDFSLDSLPPPALPVILVLALPRPKLLKRVLQMTAGFGVKSLYLIHSARVEKSFWSTPWLEPTAIYDQLVEGLSQVRDTVLPSVELRRRFRPFVEDELPALLGDRTAWVADPKAAPCRMFPPAQQGTQLQKSLICIGPEGGWVPFELALLAAQGVHPLGLGPRILRVEWALASLLSSLSASLC